jgi:hypothetical protein
MNLYLLKRDDHVGYDEYSGHVIAAPQPYEARVAAAKVSADEGYAVWIHFATLTLIATDHAGEPGIVLSSFNAG